MQNTAAASIATDRGHARGYLLWTDDRVYGLGGPLAAPTTDLPDYGLLADALRAFRLTPLDERVPIVTYPCAEPADLLRLFGTAASHVVPVFYGELHDYDCAYAARTGDGAALPLTPTRSEGTRIELPVLLLDGCQKKRFHETTTGTLRDVRVTIDGVDLGAYSYIVGRTPRLLLFDDGAPRRTASVPARSPRLAALSEEDARAYVHNLVHSQDRGKKYGGVTNYSFRKKSAYADPPPSAKNIRCLGALLDEAQPRR